MHANDPEQDQENFWMMSRHLYIETHHGGVVKVSDQDPGLNPHLFHESLLGDESHP